jgi:exodeoxyribonuclease-3
METESLAKVQKAGGWVDVMREKVPPPAKLYTWWSYRAQDWSASNRGRRLDHIWATPALARKCKRMDIHTATRGWVQTSDHVPVVAEFAS